MMATTECFYMVLNPNGRVPRRRHPNAHSAKAEAKRLAAQFPGQEFFVLCVIGRAIVHDPVVYEEFDDIPF